MSEEIKAQLNKLTIPQMIELSEYITRTIVEKREKLQIKRSISNNIKILPEGDEPWTNGRIEKRTPVDLRGAIFKPTGDAPYIKYRFQGRISIKDISSFGMRFSSDLPLKINEVIIVSLNLAGQSPKFVLTEIMRNSTFRDKGGTMYEVGAKAIDFKRMMQLQWERDVVDTSSIRIKPIEDFSVMVLTRFIKVRS